MWNYESTVQPIDVAASIEQYSPDYVTHIAHHYGGIPSAESQFWLGKRCPEDVVRELKELPKGRLWAGALLPYTLRRTCQLRAAR